jgi:tetratricopeptide (TPR) repeat protein
MTLVREKQAPGLDFSAIEHALDAPLPTSPAAPGLKAEHRRALQGALSRSGKKRGPSLSKQAAEAVDADRNLEGVRLALQALDEDPESLTAYLAGAVGLDRLGLRAESLEFYDQALQRAPNDPTIASLLGSCAQRMGELEIAERCYRVAAHLEPDDWTHISNLGGVLRDQGRFDAAVELLRSAIYVHAEAPDLWNTLGTVLQEQGRPEEAVVFLQEAARLKPGFSRAYHNLGAALFDLARYGQAREALDQALRGALPASDRAEMIAMRSWTLLGSGALEQGWAEYEARLDPLANDHVEYVIPRPRWQGEDIAGKTILAIGEQGVGDEILFANCIADLIAAVGPSGKVMIACDRRLIAMFQRTFPAAEVLSEVSMKRAGRAQRSVKDFTAWDRIDFWTPFGSLMRNFRSRLEDFPQARGFLKPDEARVAEFRRQLSGDRLNVGIAWKSLVMTPKRTRYFAPFEEWSPVLTTPGVKFYTLQPGDAAADIAMAKSRFGAEIHALDGLDVREDLDGIGAAGAALDLVVAPMNASSNMAAACGGNVWFWHRYGAWAMLGTPETPFYAGSRTFCARKTGAWSEIFVPIGADLRAMVSQRK